MSLYHRGYWHKGRGEPMKTVAGSILTSLLVCSPGLPTSYYALQVPGRSRISAMDRPGRKGRVYLFHRYPDGVYMSLAATDVAKVVALTEPPAPERLAPGQAVYVGPALPSNGFAPAPP